MDTPGYVSDPRIVPMQIVPETEGALTEVQILEVLDDLIANPSQPSGVTVGLGFLEGLRDIIHKGDT